MFTKKRLLIAASGVTAIAAAGSMIAGVTFGLFSATQTSSANTFTAGTLTLGSPVVNLCTVSHIVPGDSGNCTVQVTTGGTEPADVAIDVSVAGTPATLPLVPPYGGGSVSQGAGLFDNSVNGLQLTLTDSLNGPTVLYNLGALNAATSPAPDLLTGLGVATGTPITYTLHWSMPNIPATSNNYQGAASAFTFDVHSVQTTHQAADTTPAGNPDTTIVWS